MLLKQQKSTSMDVLNMSGLTLEEDSSSVEDVHPKTSSSKVGLIFLLLKCCLCMLLDLRVSLLQPVLEYSSAFDDLVLEVSEAAPPEPPTSPEDILECVPEEPPEAMMDPDPEAENAQENPGRTPSNVVHGPNYYFYQGGSFPGLL